MVPVFRNPDLISRPARQDTSFITEPILRLGRQATQERHAQHCNCGNRSARAWVLHFLSPQLKMESLASSHHRKWCSLCGQSHTPLRPVRAEGFQFWSWAQSTCLGHVAYYILSVKPPGDDALFSLPEPAHLGAVTVSHQTQMKRGLN